MTRPVPFLLLAAALAAPAAWGQEDAAPLAEALNAQQRVRQAAEAALEARLAKTVAQLYGPNGLLLKGVSLRFALERMIEPAGIDVRPDQRALDLDGISLADIRVDEFDVPTALPITLRTALELLLEGSGETLVLRNRAGVLTVTTAAEAELALHTRTYDVADLVRVSMPRAEAAGIVAHRPGCFSDDYRRRYFATGELGGLPSDGGLGGGFDGSGDPPAGDPLLSDRAWEPVVRYDFQPLIDLLIATTGGADDGGLWQDEGGLGTMEEALHGEGDERRAGLVIRQTDVVHRQISDLLADLRALPADPHAVAEPADARVADGEGVE